MNKIIIGNRLLVEPITEQHDNFINMSLNKKILKGIIRHVGNGERFDGTKSDLRVFKQGQKVYFLDHSNHIKVDSSEFGVTTTAPKLYLIDVESVYAIQED